MFGYFLTAAISATITMIVMACFQISKDPREDVPQVPMPRIETCDVVTVWGEAFLNNEEMNNPEPYLRRLISARLKEKLVDAMWENVMVTHCDDPANFRVQYLANIKVVKSKIRNPLAEESDPWKS